MADTHKLPEDDSDLLVELKIPIKRQLLRDLLSTAVESGTSYWAQVSKLKRTPDLEYLSVRFHEVEASEGEKRKVMTIKAEDLVIGLQRLSQQIGNPKFSAAGQHLADALSENGDAITADVVVQMTMFGELVYG